MPNEICRATIAVNRVMDCCKREIGQEQTRMTLCHVSADAQPPFTFVTATSTHTAATVSNLVIARIEGGNENRARVRCNITIPMQVTFRDSDNVQFTARSEITVPQDIVMCIPTPSVFPFEITASASCNCPSGCFVGANMVESTACIAIITKVVIETELDIPTYGYHQIPVAVDYENQVCDKFFKLPLYPYGN
jgi:hypothetical protein